MCFIEWLQNWGMLVVTVIYAGFTIGIFLSNRRANGLLKKQIHESNKQNKENRHLEVLPYFKVECTAVQAYTHSNFDIKIFYPKEDISSKDESGFKVTLENIGRGPAIDIQYLWALKNESGEYLLKGSDFLLPNALTVNGKRDLIYHVEHPYVSDMIKHGIHNLSLEAGFIYEDVQSARYRQNLMIDVEINENSPDLIIKRCYVEKQKKLETTQEQNT